MRLTRILPIILLLTSCAPAAPVAPSLTAVPPTGTSAPTAEPTSTLSPTSTSTPEPTATLTATPYPIPEGAVKTADGSTVFVKEGKLWQLDAQGQAVEKDILDVTFANVLDGSEMVRQLYPEYYENDQKLLKGKLLPEGMSLSRVYKWRVDDFNIVSGGGGHYIKTAGCVLDITKVDLLNYPSLGVDKGLMLNIAFLGAKQPIPVVLGVIDSNALYTSFIDGYAYGQVGSDLDEQSPKFKVDKISSGLDSNIADLRGQCIGMTLEGYVSPDVADKYVGTMVSIPKYADFVRDSVVQHASSLAWEVREANKVSGKVNKTSGDFLGDVVETAKDDPSMLGPGFMPNQSCVVIYETQ